MENRTEILWAEFKNYLHGFVSKQVPDTSVVDDIVQDVFVKVHLHVGELRDDTKLTSWIFQIARNAVRDHYRKSSGNIAGTGEPTEFSEDEEQENTDLLRCLEYFIEELPLKYREAVKLAEIKQISQLELADTLNMSYSGAKSRVQRGRQKLKDLILNCCEVQADAYGNIIGHTRKSCGSDCA